MNIKTRKNQVSHFYSHHRKHNQEVNLLGRSSHNEFQILIEINLGL